LTCLLARVTRDTLQGSCLNCCVRDAMAIGGEAEGGAIAAHMQVNLGFPIAPPSTPFCFAVVRLQALTQGRGHVGWPAAHYFAVSRCLAASTLLSLFNLLSSVHLLLLSCLLFDNVCHHQFHPLSPCTVSLDLCSAGPPPPPPSAPCEYGESWCNSCHTSLGSSSGSYTTGSSPHDPFPALAPCAT
jgi:hypothetical protein